VLDVAMPEVVLDQPGVRALIGQGEAAGMIEHVRASRATNEDFWHRFSPPHNQPLICARNENRAHPKMSAASCGFNTYLRP